MSLFYGYKNKEEELEERVKKLEIQLPSQFLFHRHNITFDFNVTRASKNTIFSKSKPEYVSVITDKDGESKQVSVVYYYGLVNPAILNTSGKHHFLSPKSGENASMYVNCPRIRVPNMSIFIVMKRNNVRLKGPNGVKLIFRNGSRGVKYIKDDDNITVNIMNVNKQFHITWHDLVNENLSKKHLLSIHWRSEYKESYFYINNSLKLSFTSPVSKDKDSNAYIFGGRKEHKNHSDISIYEIKMLEGFLTKEEIEENIADIMVKNEIS